MRARDMARFVGLEQKLACEDALFEEEYTRLVESGKDRSVELSLISYRQAVLRKKIATLKDGLISNAVKRDKYSDELTRRERMLELSEDNLIRLNIEAEKLIAFDFAADRAREVSEAIGKERTRNATAKRSLEFWSSKKAEIQRRPGYIGIDFDSRLKADAKPMIQFNSIDDTMPMEEKTANALIETFGIRASAVNKDDYNTDVSALFRSFE